MSLLSTDNILSKEMFLMELAAKRNFEVKYYEKDETTWVVESHVIDDPHDICIWVDINMNDFIVTDAKIEFNKFPM